MAAEGIEPIFLLVKSQVLAIELDRHVVLEQLIIATLAHQYKIVKVHFCISSA